VGWNLLRFVLRIARVSGKPVDVLEGGEEALEASGLDRLSQMIVEAGFAGLLPILFARIAGQSNYQGRFHSIQPPQAASELITVHLREANIDQGDFGSKCRCQFERRGTVMGKCDSVAPIFRGFGHSISSVGVVIDDEDAMAVG